MELSQIETTLQQRFNQSLENYEKRKLIFWEDQDEEFIEDWESIQLENVKYKKLTNSNQFSIKYLLETEDAETSYLIYTNLELTSSKNWLLDTVLYSEVFSASRIDLIMDDLEIDSSLRVVLEKYESFFDNKQRVEKLKSYGKTNYTEEVIETRIISALCNLTVPSFDTALRTILIDTLDDKNNKYLTLIEKYFDLHRFWEIIKGKYDYRRKDQSLETLFMHLAITSLSFTISEDYLGSLKNFIGKFNRNDAYVFVDQWMHHQKDGVYFKEYAKLVEREIKLNEMIADIPINQYKEADVFPMLDQAIIFYISNNLLEGLEHYDEYIELIEIRRTKHYFKDYSSLYDVLYNTIKIEHFRTKFDHGLPQGNAQNVFEAYQSVYYKMDTYYRNFYLAYDASGKNDFINKLQDRVEYIYTNWFLGELSANWSKAIKNDLIEDWEILGVKNQKNFYRNNVATRVQQGERIFVIVSDALRYEIAVDLEDRLNSETIGSTSVEPMLGVVPSITKLGMASLLPYKTLDMNDSAKVIVDGKALEGYLARKQFIEGKVEDSLVMKDHEYTNMNRSQKIEITRGKKLIYIYHNTIDSIGDNASEERNIFEAVDKSLDELFNLVKSITNELSGTNIYITADHGFLYQRNPLEESDKIANELEDPIEKSRRYAISEEQRELDGQIGIGLGRVLNNENSLTVYVPNGAIRNRIQGPGSNYVHGGASLQEIVVPLITFKNKRRDQKDVQLQEKVDVKLTSQTRRITNKIFKLRFFQTEQVVDKIIPRTVQTYLEDADGNIISNVETIIANRTNSVPEERMYEIQFALETMQFDRNNRYYLIIKDTETDYQTDKITFEISLGISSNFDFF